MQAQFNPRCFKVTSLNPEVDYVIVERDDIGWKMDVIGHQQNEWPDGDTYQNTFDELMPFLAKYTDQDSVGPTTRQARGQRSGKQSRVLRPRWTERPFSTQSGH